MNPGDHLERKSEISSDIDNGGIVQKISPPPVGSWFQRRLVYVRNEIKKEIQTKVIRLSKDQ